MKRLGITLFLLGAETASLSAMSVKELIQLAEAKDPAYQLILEKRQQTQFTPSMGMDQSPWLLSLQNERGVGDDRVTQRFSGNLDKTWPETGTSLVANHQTNSRPDRRENVTELRLEQDIYRNFFGQDARFERETLEMEQGRQNLVLEEAHEDFLFSLLTEYLDYQKKANALVLSEHALKEAMEWERYMKDRLANQVALEIEVDKATIEVLKLESERLKQKKEKEALKKALSARLGHPITEPLPELFTAKTLPPSQEIEKLRKVRELSLSARVLKNESELMTYEHRPSLKLIGGYYVDESERFSTTIDRTEVVVGLRLEVPFFDVTHDATYQHRLKGAAIKDSERRLKEQEILEEINKASAMHGSLLSELALKNRTLTLLARLVKEEERRFEYAKVDYDGLLTLKTSLANARIERSDLKLEVQKAYLEYLSLTDQLLPWRKEL